MKVARVIITMKCLRNCSYCCNKQPVIEQAKPLRSVSDLERFDEVCITGGEPMLDVDRTIEIVRKARLLPQNPKVYLYTAQYHERLGEVEDAVDGIHYTIHKTCDIAGFQEAQGDLMGRRGGKSNRLYIHPNVGEVLVAPFKWTRIESKPFLDDCPLPDNETLFILSEDDS